MTTTTHGLITTDERPQDISLMRRLPPALVILFGIIVLATILNFANIEAISSANTYYTAAIEAMLQSPSNFFFVAAEPGGSVTIDKPPLGLWLQAISAFFLGVNGFAVVLPQILAGIFSVPLLYILVRRYFGTGAGLIAALVIAVTPVSIAVQRNNTMDATLIFTMLLAAWAFIKATETGKLKWLLAGGILVGLGFNVKMLQAFLPLPAFYGLYFIGANVSWRRKIAHLAITTVVLLAVALSWIIVVDLTPADQRPYVGSSTTNSALELALGYNGLQRLLGGMGGIGNVPQPDGSTTTEDSQLVAPTTDGQGFVPPAGMDGQGFAPPAGGGIFGGEIGSAGVLRLFSQPLDNEIAWLLPFGLFSLGLLAIATRPRLPLSTEHKGVILFGGWLLTEISFFSAAGFFHAYYLAMLAPPLAALVGIGVMRMAHIYEQHKRTGAALIILSVAAALVYQFVIAQGYTDSLLWMAIPAAAWLIGSVIMLLPIVAPRFARFAIVGVVSAVIALTVAPAVWSGLSTTTEATNTTLPAAYGTSDDNLAGGPPAFARALAAAAGGMPDGGTGFPGGFGDGGVNAELVSYLQANTQGMRYMMAVSSSMQGSGYVLETGRGVLYMGGFNGQDKVVDAESLQALVDAGELRYVLGSETIGLFGGRMGGPGMIDSGITDWLASACTPVTDIELSGSVLYDCAA